MKQFEHKRRRFIAVPMTESEDRRLDRAMRRGSIILGRWVHDLIFRELDRVEGDGPKDAA